MKNKSKLPLTEDLDFQYLLCIMPLLQEIPEYQLLPELFSIIGETSLIELCSVAGGETIRIPTLEELSKSIDGLQAFYDYKIKGLVSKQEIKPELQGLVTRIERIYDAKNSQRFD